MTLLINCWHFWIFASDYIHFLVWKLRLPKRTENLQYCNNYRGTKALGFGALSPSTLLWGIQEPGYTLVQELENLDWNPMCFWLLVLYRIQYGHLSFICNQYNGNWYVFFNGAFIQELDHKAVWKSGKMMWARNWETLLSWQCPGSSAGALTQCPGSSAGAVTQRRGSRSAAAVPVLASESIFFSPDDIFWYRGEIFMFFTPSHLPFLNFLFRKQNHKPTDKEVLTNTVFLTPALSDWNKGTKDRQRICIAPHQVTWDPSGLCSCRVGGWLGW